MVVTTLQPGTVRVGSEADRSTVQILCRLIISCSTEVGVGVGKDLILFFFYLFMKDREKEREASSMQGARCGIRSWDFRITPWAEGRGSTAEPLGLPPPITFLITLRVFSSLTLHLPVRVLLNPHCVEQIGLICSMLPKAT